MSRTYQFYNPIVAYFVSFATVCWIGIFWSPMKTQPVTCMILRNSVCEDPFFCNRCHWIFGTMVVFPTVVGARHMGDSGDSNLIPTN